jgi:hypothetical protein
MGVKSLLCKINVWHHLRRYLVLSWMIIQEMPYVEPTEKTAIETMENSPLTSAWKVHVCDGLFSKVGHFV